MDKALFSYRWSRSKSSEKYKQSFPSRKYDPIGYWFYDDIEDIEEATSKELGMLQDSDDGM